jgi:hypothetical protein
MTDHPFDKVARDAAAKVRDGFTIYQKFTCAGCGNRLTIDVPNQFFETGACDNCDAITDIKKQGCNYLLMTTPVSEILATKKPHH